MSTRKVKVVRPELPEISNRCPVCQKVLTELLDARGMPSFLDKRLNLAGGLFCEHCGLCFEVDGETGLVGEVELWGAGDMPSGSKSDG